MKYSAQVETSKGKVSVFFDDTDSLKVFISNDELEKLSMDPYELSVENGWLFIEPDDPYYGRGEYKLENVTEIGTEPVEGLEKVCEYLDLQQARAEALSFRPRRPEPDSSDSWHANGKFHSHDGAKFDE